MDQIMALRPFVPAGNFDQSERFYQILSLVHTIESKSIIVEEAQQALKRLAEAETSQGALELEALHPVAVSRKLTGLKR